jgi:hypothetical protein
LVVLAEGIPEPVVQVADRLTKVSLGRVWLKQAQSCQPMSESVGQVRSDLTRCEFPFNHREQSDYRGQITLVTGPWRRGA